MSETKPTLEAEDDFNFTMPESKVTGSYQGFLVGPDGLCEPERMVARLVTENARMGSVCEEIKRIMHTYREQEASARGVATPGGLEHMGDVWRLLGKWDAALQPAPVLDLGEIARVLTGYYAGHQGGSDPTRNDCQCEWCEKTRALLAKLREVRGNKAEQ